MTDKKRVVVTGIGVLASNGVGKDNFFKALMQGASGIKPVSLFDTSGLKVKTAGEIKDFDAHAYLGPKGLRTFDRSTKLAICAAKMALLDAGISMGQENAQATGIAIGSTLGSIKSISDFDREALLDGPQYVNPAFFPNTVINSPASQVSIWLNIRGFNATISTGFCAGLDAVAYAAEYLRQGRAQVVLAGGVEELCIQTYLGFYKTGFLAGLDSQSLEISCPFDKRRNGIIFGEGASVVILEELGVARARNAPIYAEIEGCGSFFDAYRLTKYSPRPEGLARSMELALAEAGCAPSDIEYISAAANSHKTADALEAKAIKKVFKGFESRVKMSALKSMLGECFSASGALQVAGAVAAIEKQTVPPTINYEEPDAACDLPSVVNEAVPCKINNVLINACGPNGSNTSLIISRYRDV